MRYITLFCLFKLLILEVAIGEEAILHFVRGEVAFNDRPIQRGEEVLAGGVLSTGKDSLAIVRFSKGSTIRLNEESSMRIAPQGMDEQQARGRSVIGLLRGQILSRVNKESDEDFNISTRFAHFAVRGTEFFVGIDDNDPDAAWMCVNEGLVLARGRDDKEFQKVTKGMGVLISNRSSSTPSFFPWTQTIDWSMDGESISKTRVEVDDLYREPFKREYD